MSMADRKLCDILGCGRPAVDYLEKESSGAPEDFEDGVRPGDMLRLYLCAEHWDEETSRAWSGRWRKHG
jgi:hypothetical protein